MTADNDTYADDDIERHGFPAKTVEDGHTLDGEQAVSVTKVLVRCQPSSHWAEWSKPFDEVRDEMAARKERQPTCYEDEVVEVLVVRRATIRTEVRVSGSR